MREFILYSRKGRTDPRFRSLREAGRLDVVQECIVASLFLSHGIRRDVVFHATLYGPPSPPLHLKIDGSTLWDVRTDQGAWEEILRKVLSGKQHPGISISKQGFEALLKQKHNEAEIYVLEEGGRDISEIEFAEHPVFVLGDHIGLPKKVEGFALRYGQKVSLGRQP
ncbi:MAG: tRNA (pseudouridine(54)-N(1))-methyltransferase TrmY, partial [Candidatus Bathyarchaeia archaeon]